MKTSVKLKDLISVGDIFFFASSDDLRVNGYWERTLTVTKVGNKLVTLENNHGHEFKAYLNESQKVKTHILVLKQDAGASVFGFKDRAAFEATLEKRKIDVMLHNTDWRNLSYEKVKAIAEILAKSDEEIK